MPPKWLTQLVDEYAREGYLDYVEWHDSYGEQSERLHRIREVLSDHGADLGQGCAAVGLSLEGFLHEYLWTGANGVGGIGRGVFSIRTREAALGHVHNDLTLPRLLERVLRSSDQEMHRAYRDVVAWFSSLKGPGHKVSTVAIHRFFTTLLPGRVTILFNEADVDYVGRFLGLQLSGDWFQKNVELMEYLGGDWPSKRLDDYYRTIFFWPLLEHLRGAGEEGVAGLDELLGELADADIDPQVARTVGDLVAEVMGKGNRDPLHAPARGSGQGNFNLIPSGVPGACWPLLLVFSFGLGDFRRRMRETVRHLLLSCYDTTRVVVFAAEEWDDAYFEAEVRVVATFLARVRGVRFIAVTKERGRLVVSRMV